MLSAATLLVTGYGWSNYRDLQQGMATSKVTEHATSDGATDILLVGADSRTDAHGNPLPDDVLAELNTSANEATLTDSIILLHIPDDGSSAVGFSFPRDTFVDIPGHGQHKINSAFSRGKDSATAATDGSGTADPAELERRGADAGRQTLLSTVEELTGVSVDHYAEVNLLGFSRITESVGGVPVCLNQPVSDELSGADFSAGEQTVSGGEALAFVRQRHGLPRGDLDRVVRQQAFLAGLTQKMLSGGVLANPGKLSDLIGSLQQSIVLDDGWDVFSFAQRLRGLAGGAVRFSTIPIEDPAYPTPDGEAVKVDTDEVRDAVNQAIEGPAPQATSGGDLAVDVLNTTERSGLAQRVGTRIEDEGLALGETGNAPARDTSVVRHAPGSDEQAARVAAMFGDLDVEEGAGVPPGHVQVLLGADFREHPAPRMAPPSKVQLDGGGESGQEPATITADDVPCVN
ncbi:LCP family protein [Saccharopolyspora montiporae]|uniref:LCP family protein n=1 Tax=Saccharopolyspora montiporae TaxID=2781240 RepID=UPI00351C184E